MDSRYISLKICREIIFYPMIESIIYTDKGYANVNKNLQECILIAITLCLFL